VRLVSADLLDGLGGQGSLPWRGACLDGGVLEGLRVDLGDLGSSRGYLAGAAVYGILWQMLLVFSHLQLFSHDLIILFDLKCSNISNFSKKLLIY